MRSLPLTPLEFTNLTSDSRMKSLLAEVIASSLASRLHDSPVRLRELQFCELTVKEGASTAPAPENLCSYFNYRVVVLLEGTGGCLVLAVQGLAVSSRISGSLLISEKSEFCL